MREIRSQPASFSMSLRTVIWKNTDTRQCRMLRARTRHWSIQGRYAAKVWLNLGKSEFTAPRVKEEGEPESGELVWDLWVEERQQTTHVVHAVNLQETVISSVMQRL